MTSSSNISQELCQFIHRFVPTVVQLEVILLIAERQAFHWTVDKVSDELRSEHTLIAVVLENLHRAGLLSTSGSGQNTCFRFAPQDADLIRQVNALAALYRERRYSVLTVIYDYSRQR